MRLLSSNSLPSPQEIRQQFRLTPAAASHVAQKRQEVVDILQGHRPQLLLIVGPCSIHDITAAKEYATKLKKLGDEVAPHICLIMRTYGEKARSAVGWKGLIYDPYLDNSHALEEGIKTMRHLLVDLAEMEVATATEFLDPLISLYLQDAVVWGSIGARTSSSQIHRQFASATSTPTGFKNSTSGDIESAILGMVTAASPHTFISVDDAGKTAVQRSAGNPHTHLVLRGGQGKPNYDKKTIQSAVSLLKSYRLPSRLLIDCSHDNCQKDYEKQTTVFYTALENYLSGETAIAGLMLESSLLEGRQSPHSDVLQYGISVTDPCLSWDTTRDLILYARDVLAQMPSPSSLLP